MKEGRKEKKEMGRSEGVHPWCVTVKEALNNSHDIDLVTLPPTSLPHPNRASPPVGFRFPQRVMKIQTESLQSAW